MTDQHYGMLRTGLEAVLADMRRGLSEIEVAHVKEEMGHIPEPYLTSGIVANLRVAACCDRPNFPELLCEAIRKKLEHQS